MRLRLLPIETIKSSLTKFTGESFKPIKPKINQIKIEDIAHALSMMCRANGHIMRFYSVAQHCINCAEEANARNMTTREQLACLLHDGSESYLSDITRPVKKYLPEYILVEKNFLSIFESGRDYHA